jgi:antitoxin ParD1/3/4
MPTQNVNLTPELDHFVKKAVESGAFNNASEVHRAALLAMAREQEERELRLTRLRREIQLGLDSGSTVEITDLNDFMDQCAEAARKETPRKIVI